MEFLKTYKWDLLLALLILSVASFFLSDYMLWSLTAIIGWLLVPLVIYIQRKGSHLDRSNLIIAVVAFLLFAATQLTTMYYIMLILMFGVAVQLRLGAMGKLPIILLAMVTPTYVYLKNTIGIPLRIELGEWAANILHQLGADISIVGNEITYAGDVFLIDGACAGLNMLTYSLYAGVIVIAFFERKQEVILGWSQIMLLMLLLILLNLVGNVVRIIVLILFAIPQESSFHDSVGVICLLIYVIIPFYFVSKWFIRRYVGIQPIRIFQKAQVLKWALSIIIISSAFLLSLQPEKIAFQPRFPAGYEVEEITGNVLKCYKEGSLIYIKPVGRFFHAEHAPLICWTGSGYKLSRVALKTIHHKEIYTAIMKKGDEEIYTAWWFDSGDMQTINQWEWRWHALKTGQVFNLVNVSARSEMELNSNVKLMLPL